MSALKRKRTSGIGSIAGRAAAAAAAAGGTASSGNKRRLTREEREELAEFGEILPVPGGADSTPGSGDRPVRVLDFSAEAEHSAKRGRSDALDAGDEDLDWSTPDQFSSLLRSARKASSTKTGRRSILASAALSKRATTVAAPSDTADISAGRAPMDSPQSRDSGLGVVTQRPGAKLRQLSESRRSTAATAGAATSATADDGEHLDIEGDRSQATSAADVSSDEDADDVVVGSDDDADADETDSEDEDELNWFELHFGESVSEEIPDSVEMIRSLEAAGTRWPCTQLPAVPQLADDQPSYTSLLGNVAVSDLLEAPETEQLLGDLIVDPAVPAPLSQLGYSKRMEDAWLEKAYSDASDGCLPLHRSLLAIMAQYRDLLFDGMPAAGPDALATRQAVSLHAVHHVLRAQRAILRHNQMLAQPGAPSDLDCRDQGFTRPRVLVVTPLRSTALVWLDTLMGLVPGQMRRQVLNRKATRRGYLAPELSSREKALYQRKPADWRDIFGGNNDDCFRLGIKLNRSSVALGADEYESDIIIASPLGIRLLTGTEGEKKRNYDFLSSVEMVVVDQANTIAMQNWDHLLSLFEHLNLQPREARDTDFSRIKNWVLDGHSKYLRQNIFLSSFLFPELNALFSRYSLNHSGRVRATQPVPRGTIGRVIAPVQQVFHRVRVKSLSGLDDERFGFLEDVILAPMLHKHRRILLVVPSYLEFVRVRRMLKERSISFVAAHEYQSSGENSRARSFFRDGRAELLVYTERLHFYRRLNIIGAKHLVFYAPPTNGQFYPELVNILLNPIPADTAGGPAGRATGGSDDEDGAGSRRAPTATLDNDGDRTCSLIFCQPFDALALARIVGEGRARKMLTGEQDAFMFS
ncbi:hypothetical protein H696_04243 [Fonticula alba]|uniref:U3 small nucleolar RNA-associated protein 25 n=1 Tax=Fonticula alba TaxID=691883 RepID=A0A058Z3W1_FONAL|nr:hypothetical protein H696_04243 [Fonticula alba]KCV68826.1 hypothetical protein H696_04243 [Fonticula alba]|eukprot:XP_009496397.1 hypothetical protein H696_04243 [Fonticula alba]